MTTLTTFRYWKLVHTTDRPNKQVAATHSFNILFRVVGNRENFGTSFYPKTCQRSILKLGVKYFYSFSVFLVSEIENLISLLILLVEWPSLCSQCVRVIIINFEMNLILFYTIFYSRNIFTRINYYIIWKQKGSCRSLVFRVKFDSSWKSSSLSGVMYKDLLWSQKRSRDDILTSSRS